MKFSDFLIGAVLMIIGVGVLCYGLTLPPMVGQRYGAGLFPMLLGCCFAGFGAHLAFAGWRERRAEGTPMVSLADWARDRRLAGNMLIVLALIVVYVVFSTRIGFVPLSLAMLMILLLRFRVPPLRSAVIAVGATLFIQVAFAHLLRVPLPRGILDRVLW